VDSESDLQAGIHGRIVVFGVASIFAFLYSVGIDDVESIIDKSRVKLSIIYMVSRKTPRRLIRSGDKRKKRTTRKASKRSSRHISKAESERSVDSDRFTGENRRETGEIVQADQHGWKVIHIYGNAYDRGFAHGHLLRHEMKQVADKLYFMVTVILNMSYTAYMKYCQRHITPIVQYEYPELYEELRGICDGCGGILTLPQLIAWNAWLSMYTVDLPPPPTTRVAASRNRRKKRPKPAVQRCSAFIATGNATRAGAGIVMAHNTHSDMVSATLFNVIVYLTPQEGAGSGFVMQTCAGYIASGADWFITSAGIIGCETTISDANYALKFNRRDRHPYFCRIRRAMQYGSTLDDYAHGMITHSAGDYPCSWLFGNIHTGEIMLCENGWKLNSVQRTFHGVFYGMNSAHDFALRNEETDDLSYTDTATSSGARNVRLDALLNHTYYGKIDVNIAKRILSDHYDVHVEKDHHPSSTTICNHYFMDPDTDSPHYPHSSIDGKVVDSRMAKDLAFWGRWGASCGLAFSAKDHVRKYPLYQSWAPYLVDLPTQPWTILQKIESK
jgi:hypothetical protein